MKGGRGQGTEDRRPQRRAVTVGRRGLTTDLQRLQGYWKARHTQGQALGSQRPPVCRPELATLRSQISRYLVPCPLFPAPRSEGWA